MKALSNSKECPNCGDDHKSRPMCVYDNGWWCFSCSSGKKFSRGFTEIRIKPPKIEEFPEATNYLSLFSIEAQQWLMQYSIGEREVKEYGIYYVEDNSIIMLNKETGFYQKRNMLERKITTYGEKKPHLLEGNSTTVIVEDYISAIRIRESGFSALCLYGTKVSGEQLENICAQTNSIVLWLDDDVGKEVNSGQVAAKKIYKQISYIIKRKFGFSPKKVYNIRTDKDPKCYTNTEIKSIVEGALNGQ